MHTQSPILWTGLPVDCLVMAVVSSRGLLTADVLPGQVGALRGVLAGDMLESWTTRARQLQSHGWCGPQSISNRAL